MTRLGKRTKGLTFNKELIQVKNLVFALVVGTGLILFWRGIWDASKSFIDAYQAIAIGMAILILSGMATKIFFIGTSARR